MPKERLDLMVDGTVKRMLRDVAASEGLSMSQLVEMMLMEHLSGEGSPEEPMRAVADMLWIQRLQGEFAQAMAAGTVYSFDKYCELKARGLLPDTDAPEVLYVGETAGRFEQWEIVLDCLVDELHEDIVGTYDDVLRTVSVRLGWAEGDDGSLEPYDICVYPKGRANGYDSLFDWSCDAEWPGLAVRDSPEGE